MIQYKVEIPLKALETDWLTLFQPDVPQKRNAYQQTKGEFTSRRRPHRLSIAFAGAEFGILLIPEQIDGYAGVLKALRCAVCTLEMKVLAKPTSHASVYERPVKCQDFLLKFLIVLAENCHLRFSKAAK
jgi:hypothetical protein